MNDATQSTHLRLEPLGQTDLTVRDPAEDIRGRTVYDRNGDDIGAVDELLIDAAERKVRFMRVVAGGFLGIGSEKFLIPIDAITEINSDTVSIDQTRERVAAGPKYDPALTDEDYFGAIAAHYGYAPYWASGYVYPAYPWYRKEQDDDRRQV